MNTYTQNISTWIRDENFLKQLESHLKANPNHQFNVNNIPVSLEKAVEKFEYLTGILLQSIENEQFEELPVPSQHQIHNQVQALYQNRTNVNQFINLTESLYYHLTLSGIENKLKGYTTFKKSLTEIAGLRRSYSANLKGLDVLKNQVKKVESNYNKSIELLESFTNKKKVIEDNLKSSEDDLESVSQLFEDIRKAKQEIEDSKKEVVAFKNNIDSYKSDITEKSENAQKIISEFTDYKETVKKLIEDSEIALGLKASEGMSAALSVQYDKEESVKKRRQWLIASLAFLIVAFIGIILLIINFKMGEQEIVANNINAIIARIVFVTIAIAGATFTSKQYLKQKKLADEYAYKLVLAKSIVAFTQEIKRHSPEQAAAYLTNVLEEINKSPFRNSNEDTPSLTEKNIGLIEKLFNSIKNKGT